MSEEVIPFKCPSCGGEQFRTAQEIRSYQDFTGAVCVGCERPIADDDIKNHAIALARQLVGDAFKKQEL
ncbi:ECs_2282 family putative zinc-binding protein [Rhizobium sp. 11_C7_N12_5]|uniref:ECs_2282 family putative zinc-binding protein n=1 Tax=Rhizobium sp. 11_C7_N12_5 TaxID=3240770 RepID=UPI003F261E4E